MANVITVAVTESNVTVVETPLNVNVSTTDDTITVTQANSIITVADSVSNIVVSNAAFNTITSNTDLSIANLSVAGNATIDNHLTVAGNVTGGIIAADPGLIGRANTTPALRIQDTVDGTQAILITDGDYAPANMFITANSTYNYSILANSSTYGRGVAHHASDGISGGDFIIDNMGLKFSGDAGQFGNITGVKNIYTNNIESSNNGVVTGYIRTTGTARAGSGLDIPTDAMNGIVIRDGDNTGDNPGLGGGAFTGANATYGYLIQASNITANSDGVQYPAVVHRAIGNNSGSTGLKGCDFVIKDMNLKMVSGSGSPLANAQTITTSGNIESTAGFILGNGSQLTGISTTDTDSFGTLTVSGETNIQASQANAILDIASTDDITLTTSGNTLTIGRTGGAGISNAQAQAYIQENGLAMTSAISSNSNISTTDSSRGIITNRISPVADGNDLQIGKDAFNTVEVTNTDFHNKDGNVTFNINDQGTVAERLFLGKDGNVIVDVRSNPATDGSFFKIQKNAVAKFIVDGNTGNVSASNVDVVTLTSTGNVTTTANVSGNYILGDGSQLTNLPTGGITNAQAQAYIQDNGLNGSGDITMTGVATFGNAATQTHTFTGNVDVTGNIEVSGNLNYRNVEDLYVRDQSITLNANAASDATVQIIANRPVAGSNTVLRWNETDDKWQFSNDGSTFYNLISNADSQAYIQSSGLTMTADITSTNLIKTTGNLQVNADTDVSGLSGLTFDSATNNLGLGTPTPKAALHIRGTSNESQIFMTEYNGTSSAGIDLRTFRAGGTEASPTVTPKSDRIWESLHYAYDGVGTSGDGISSGFQNAFSEQIITDPVVDHANYTVPVFKQYYTYLDGDTTTTAHALVRMRSNGDIQFNAGNAFAYTGAANTVISNAGNITTVGNISGNYILGDGSQLSNLPTGVSNAQAQAYIQTSGLAMTANVTSNSLISTTGNLQVNPDTVVGGLKGLTFDSSTNRLGLGTTTPAAAIDIVSDNDFDAQIYMQEYRDTFFGPDIRSYKARGTLSSPTAAQAGDRMLEYRPHGYDGTQFLPTVGMMATVDSTSTVATNILPTLFSWEGYKDGDVTTSYMSLMKLRGNGDFQIGNLGLGASNTAPNFAVTHSGTVDAVGNITTTANISGNYILGNGSLLTGITDVSNAQAQAYIQSNGLTMTADITSTNLIKTTGNLQVNPDTVVGGLKGLTFDSATNRLGLGTTTPSAGIHMVSDDDFDAQVYLEEYKDSFFGPDLRFFKARGTLSSPTRVQAGDRMSDYKPYGHTGNISAPYSTNGFINTMGMITAVDVTNVINDVTMPTLFSWEGYKDGDYTGATPYGSLMKLRANGDFQIGNLGLGASNTAPNFAVTNGGDVTAVGNITSDAYLIGDNLQLTNANVINGAVTTTANISINTRVDSVPSNATTNVSDVQAYNNGNLTEDSITIPGGQILDDGTAITYSGATDGDITPLNGRVYYIKFNAGDGGRYELFDDSGFTTGSRRVTNGVFRSSGVGQFEYVSSTNVAAGGNLNVGGSNAVIQSLGGNITSVGNISGSYILGDGSQLTNLPTGGDSFGTITVAGQTNIQATQSNAILDIASSGAITLSTSGNTLTIGGSGGSYGNSDVETFLGSDTMTGDIVYTGNLQLSSANVTTAITEYQGNVTSGVAGDRILVASDPGWFSGQNITFSGTTNANLTFLNGNTYEVQRIGATTYDLYTNYNTFTRLNTAIGTESNTNGLQSSTRQPLNTTARFNANVYVEEGATLHADAFKSSTPNKVISMNSLRVTDFAANDPLGINIVANSSLSGGAYAAPFQGAIVYVTGDRHGSRGAPAYWDGTSNWRYFSDDATVTI